MDFQLTEENRKMVDENRGLVFLMLKQLNFKDTDYYYDDLAQLGMLGLCKAAVTFDESKGVKFSTFAARCIRNEIGMFLRKQNKENIISTNQSIDMSLNSEGDSDELTIDMTLSDEEDFVEKMVNKEEFIERINIILNFLNSFERMIALFKLAGFNQFEIARFFKRDKQYQSFISKKEKEITKKLTNRRFFYYSNVYKFESKSDAYVLTFLLDNEETYNKFLKLFLEEIALNKNCSTLFKSRYVNGKVTFFLEKCQKSFAFIALMMKIIDSDFSK